MTATDFFNAALKHWKVFTDVSYNMADLDHALDGLLDDYGSYMDQASDTLHELYTTYVPDEKKLTSLNQIVAATDKAFVELEKIMTEVVKISEGEYIDTEEMDKEAEEGEWSDEQKDQAFWDDVQFQWDDFIENLQYDYWPNLRDVFVKDQKLSWDYAYEVRNILRGIEEEIGQAKQAALTDDVIEDYIRQNSDIEIDFDKDNVKALTVQYMFEGYD